MAGETQQVPRPQEGKQLVLISHFIKMLGIVLQNMEFSAIGSFVKLCNYFWIVL